MVDLPPVDTIVQDIEFELLLGIAPSDDLARALTEIRREQNRIRREYTSKRGRVDGRDVAGALLGVNDMLMGLLQEALSRLARVESVVDRVAGRLSTPAVDDGTPEGGEKDTNHRENFVRAIAPGAPALWPNVDLTVHPIPLPIAGRLIDQLRLALHKVALYYVHRLAEQQGVVNVYQAGEVEQLKHLVDQQQHRLAELEAEMANLQAHATPSGTDQDAGIVDG